MRIPGPRTLPLLVIAFAACSKSGIPADRPVTSFYGSSAADANRAALPKGFTAPDEHQCAADPTRPYIAEIFFHGIDDIQVTEHWAPIVTATGTTPRRRSIDQPEFSLAGTITGVSDSSDDVLGDHPFGPDINADIAPDPAQAFLVFEGSRKADALHAELEQRLLPRAALGFSPQAGDRVLMRGAWILDCGHPPYGAELHPPTFVHYARASDARTTQAATVVVPYRSSLLFNRNTALSADFANAARFTDPESKPFGEALVATILHAVVSNDDRLAAHGLLIPTHFDKLDWLVCAPLPRPAGAKLDAHWRYATRTGVTLKATSYEAEGCVRFEATMDAAYQPMALAHVDADWPWDQLSASASGQLGQPIDVRQAIIQLLARKGIDGSKMPSLQPDHAPVIDAYPALQPRAGASADAPTAIDAGADDQPFPLYGRAFAGWKS